MDYPSLFRITFVSDNGIGKSNFILRYINNTFIPDYDPTIEDTYRKEVIYNNESYYIELLDLSGGEEYFYMRDSSFRSSHAFMLLYSITSRISFDRCCLHYLYILKTRHTDKLNMILIGTKCDLENERQVLKEEGQELANILGCSFYETSAKDNININNSVLECLKDLIENPLYNRYLPYPNRRITKRCILM